MHATLTSPTTHAAFIKRAMALLLAAFCLFTGQAGAVSITVNNSSFDKASLTSAGAYVLECPDQWTCSSGFSAANGVYWPSFATYPNNSNGLPAGRTVPDGNTAVFVEPGNNSTVSLSQSTSATVANNTTYTLDVWAGRRFESFGNSWLTNTIQLLAGNTVIASLVLSAPFQGYWQDYNVSYTSGASDPYVGQTLKIALVAARAVLPERIQTNWDQVTLTAVAAAVVPGGFNAFEHATAPAAVSGVIHTKIAGAPFNTTLDVVALNTNSSAVLTTFTGDVKVELLDAHDNSGALTGSCRASWTPISGTATTLTFAGADAGRKTVTLAEPNAWREARVRISTPATGSPTTVGCSTDNFAIRPAAFASFSATDADWQSAGTGRVLSNVTVNGGVAHKAGQPFTVRASAVNAASATTSNYVGTASATLTACAGAACPATLGSFAATSLTATAGAISTSATYSEVGAFTLQLKDTSFTSVDAADGSSPAELTIASPLLDVGRFVPDHFELTSLTAPVLKTFGTTTCATRSFTYLGQPFGYATAPRATLLAKNAAGATTANYSGALWPVTLIGASVTQTYTPTPAAPTLDTTSIAAPALASSGNGTGIINGNAGDSLRFNRPAAPLAPFNANIALTWSAQDASEAGVSGNGTISTPVPFAFSNIAFDSGSQFRFGVLHLTPAYGSELLNLPVPLEARYWDGVRWATNTADQCTTLATTAAAMGNYQKNLVACKTAIAATTVTLVDGRTTLNLAKPGNGFGGSVDVALQLGAAASGQTCSTVGGAQSAATLAASPNLTWLQGGAAFDQNPSTRASFGQYRAPLIYLRENY